MARCGGSPVPQIQPCNLRTKEGENNVFILYGKKTPTTTAQSGVRPRPDDMNHVKRRAPSRLGVKVSCSCALEFDAREGAEVTHYCAYDFAPASDSKRSVCG